MTAETKIIKQQFKKPKKNLVKNDMCNATVVSVALRYSPNNLPINS